MRTFLLVLLVTAAGASGTEDEAMGGFLSGSRIAISGEEGRTRFFARPPIMRKGFDLEKGPKISERALHRHAWGMFPKPRHRMPVVYPDPVIDYTIIVSRPDPSVEYKLHRIPSPPEMGRRIQSMRERPLGVWDLDVGRYQAVIVQDPRDRRGIRGSSKRSPCRTRGRMPM